MTQTELGVTRPAWSAEHMACIGRGVRATFPALLRSRVALQTSCNDKQKEAVVGEGVATQAPQMPTTTREGCNGLNEPNQLSQRMIHFGYDEALARARQ